MARTWSNGDYPIFKVGLAVGHGTGAELAEIFELVLEKMASKYSVKADIIRSPRVYQTYFSMNPLKATFQAIQNENEADVRHYESFCEELVRTGSRIVFRTAINAQSLYLIREHQQAVKIECFSQGQNSMLLVRDEAQGFYTGINEYDSSCQSVSRSSTFSKDLMGRIIAYALARAKNMWDSKHVESIDLIYKFHLFDGVMSRWAEDWTQTFGIQVNFVQPDTANRNFLRYGVQGKQLIIAGNEWADIMHVMLLKTFGQGEQEKHCTENVYLKPELHELTEYQTVHGSADDISGKGLVNPTATFRAAARVLAHHEDCGGIVERTESTLESLTTETGSLHQQFAKGSTAEKTQMFLARF